MLADLGRLRLAQRVLDHGHDRMVWIDTNVFVFAPARMQIPQN